MANLKQLYKLHNNSKQSDIGGMNGLDFKPKEKKYSREQIINARYFSKKERNFLDWLLVEDEYTISQVKELVQKEMERTVE